MNFGLVEAVCRLTRRKPYSHSPGQETTDHPTEPHNGGTKVVRETIQKMVTHEERCEVCGEWMTWHAHMNYKNPKYHKPEELYSQAMPQGSFERAMASSGYISPQAPGVIGHYSCENGCGYCPRCLRKLRKNEQCGCWKCRCCYNTNRYAGITRKGELCSVCGCAEGQCNCDRTHLIIPGGFSP